MIFNSEDKVLKSGKHLISIYITDKDVYKRQPDIDDKDIEIDREYVLEKFKENISEFDVDKYIL